MTGGRYLTAFTPGQLDSLVPMMGDALLLTA